MKNIRETIKTIIREESEYQQFFRKALEKTGKSIPDMSDAEKKAFFNKIDAAWDGKGEKNEGNAFGAAVVAAKKAGEDEFEVGGKTFKVESVNENNMSVVWMQDHHEKGKKIKMYVVPKAKASTTASNLKNRYRDDMDTEVGIMTLDQWNKLPNSQKDLTRESVKEAKMDRSFLKKIEAVIKKDLGVSKLKVTGPHGSRFIGKETFFFSIDNPTHKIEVSKQDFGGMYEDFYDVILVNSYGHYLDDRDAKFERIPEKEVLKTVSSIAKKYKGRLTYAGMKESVNEKMDTMTKAQWNKTHKDYKSIRNGVHYVLKMTDSGTASVPVKIVEDVNENASRTAMEIGGLTGLNKNAVQKFVDDNNLDIEKVFQYVKKGKLSQRMDFVTAVAGKPGNPIQKKLMNVFKESVNEAKSKYTKGQIVNYIPKLSGLNPNKKLEIDSINHRKGDSLTKGGWYYGFKGTSLTAHENDIKISESVNEIRKGSIVMPYAMDKYGEFIVDKVFKNKDGETSYTGKFKKSGETREFILHSKDKIVKESVNENFSADDIAKIKGAVESASSFMGIGAELKKLGMKYGFSTEPLAMYMIKKGAKTFVLINKRYADNPDFVVGSTAGGLLEGKLVNEEIAVGKMVKVDNPHWEGALGKKGPFKRKVKMIDGDNVFFTDGSNSSMKYVKESVEFTITEALVPVDKKAVDAFFDKKPFEGKNLNSDGKVLKTVGVGSQEMFIHTPNGVRMVGKVTGKYAQSLVQYVNKTHKSDLVETISEGNAFGAAVTQAKKDGKTEFEFNGKTYKVKKGSYEKNEAAKKLAEKAAASVK